MNKEEIKVAIIELLYDLHSKNLLNEYIIDSISRNFKVDASEICIENGITYYIE